MKPGQASVTAQRVAAHRLTFEREPAAFGDPAADEQLARDVAGGVVVDAGGMMVPYLRARTAFFDRVVVRSLEAGVGQVVVAAAGYDGRALRYAKPDVRWFEVDHPDTQRDKQARLERLGIKTDHVRFVAADFTVDDVAAGLRNAGHDAARLSVFLCEGVAVYLDLAVLESLLRGLRTQAPRTQPVGDQPLRRQRIGCAQRSPRGVRRGRRVDGRARPDRAHRRRRATAVREDRLATPRGFRARAPRRAGHARARDLS